MTKYTTAWSRFVDAGGRWSAQSMLSWIENLAKSSARPMGKVFKFRATIQLIADTAGVPSPFSDRLLVRIAKGLIRTNTTVGRNQGPTLDMERVLRYLKAATMREAAAGRVVRRHEAIAAVAAVVPSRPSELTGLQLHEPVFIFKKTSLGVPDTHLSASSISSTNLPAPLKLGTPFPGFIVEFTVHNSKTDKLRRYGIKKSLPHPDGSDWSPALVFLRWCSVRPQRKFVYPKESSGDAQLAVPTLSRELCDVALAATGVRVSARYWRPAAATWLLICGLDVETVAALGGWATTESLRKYYIRIVTWRPDVAAAIAGVPVPARPPTTPDPLVSKPPAMSSL